MKGKLAGISVTEIPTRRSQQAHQATLLDYVRSSVNVVPTLRCSPIISHDARFYKPV